MAETPTPSAMEATYHPQLTDIGLTLDFNADWPVYAVDRPQSRQLYQAIAETGGIVFLRYGVQDTIENYLAPLGGERPAQIEQDEAVAHHGVSARRIQALLSVGGGEMYGDTPQGPQHHAEPVTQDRVVVIGFEARGTPVLIGYRVPISELATYQRALTAILESVRVQ